MDWFRCIYIKLKNIRVALASSRFFRLLLSEEKLWTPLTYISGQIVFTEINKRQQDFIC